MNRNQLLLLMVLVAVLGGAGLILYKKQSTSWTGGGAGVGQKLLGEFQVNDVAQILIKHRNSEVLLAKKDNTWRVRERGDYAANFSEISELLLKLRDLKVIQTEQVGSSQLGRLELLPPGESDHTGTLLELRDAGGKEIKSLRLGKKHVRKNTGSPMGDSDAGGWPDGRYVMVGAAVDTVALISDPLNNAEPKAEQWLSKDFFKVEKIKSIAVTFPEATNSWRVGRDSESGEWKLADAKPEEQLDSAKTSGFSYALSSPSFNDVLVAADPEATGLNEATQITLETFEDFRYDIKVGGKQDDSYHITVSVTANLPKERASAEDEKPEDKARLDKEFADAQKKLQEKLSTEQALGKFTYLVSSWTVDSLLKRRGELLADKKSEPETHEESTSEDSESAEMPALDGNLFPGSSNP